MPLRYCTGNNQTQAACDILAAMRKKQDLPQKMCLHCGLPFSWRKKWERDWEQVRYCSKRCSGAGKHKSAKPQVQS